MLRPVNNAGLNTCQWGSLGEERLNVATQLTPWRKENWPLWNGLLKCGGHHSGGPTQDKTVRETQNPLWQTMHYARHKPQTGSPRFRRYFYWMYLHTQNPPHAWNTDDRCFYFHCHTQRLIKQIELILSQSWMMGGTLLSIHPSPPKYNAFRSISGLFYHLNW